jgi:hypothetical protein
MPLAQCIAMLALDAELQNMLLDAGVLWFLVHFIFQYDYTLEEGGVERAKESNKQVRPALPGLWFFLLFTPVNANCRVLMCESDKGPRV